MSQDGQRSLRWGRHQIFVLSQFIFVAVINVVTELVREFILSELLCANYVTVMSVTRRGHKNK